MSAIGLLPPRILGSLHELACAGPSDCSCVPIFVVESPAGERSDDYNESEQRAERDSAPRSGIEYTPNRPRRPLLSQRGVGDARFHRGIDR